MRVDTIQVLEKEEARREKLLGSTLGEQRVVEYTRFLYKPPVHPYVIINGFIVTPQHRLEAQGPDMRPLSISML